MCTQSQEGECYEGGGRDWADVTTRQVMPRAASQHQKLGESLGHWPAHTLMSGLLS